MTKYSLRAMAISFIALFVSGCESSELIFYEHNPSINFYQRHDTNSDDIQPFLSQGVVFSINFRNIGNPPSYNVWQGFYTEESGREVFLKRAVIEGERLHNEFIIEKSVSLNEKDEESGLFLGSIMMFEIEGNILEEIFQHGSMNIKIDYEIDGEEISMIYQIQRRVEKYAVFPT